MLFSFLFLTRAHSIAVERVHGMDKVGVRLPVGPMTTENLHCWRFSAHWRPERCRASLRDREAGSRKIQSDGTGFICDHKRQWRRNQICILTAFEEKYY